MLNQTFTVLFESLFINELGQAGEGKVWFKTKPIEEWIAENTPPISEQPISFMDFDPGTTVFPVVITGMVVLPNGQVTVVTPNGTFLADTILIPRPVLKPTVLEDKNGNQFIVHPDGTVTNLGQAGFIPKPMTTEEKLDKIRRGLYLEALKDYKTQIETYYTSKNEPIPTRGPRNHNKNIIIDLPECIGTEANEIKDNFLAIKDNVNKKELRNSNLNLTLRTSKKLTYDALAQIALTNLSTKVKITETEFSKFLSGSEFKKQVDTTCGTWKGGFFKRKMTVYLHPAIANDILNTKLPEIAEILREMIKGSGNDNIIGDATRGFFDIRVEVNNTPLGNEEDPRLINKADGQRTDCHITMFEGAASGYTAGGTLPAEGSYVNSLDNVPATRSRVTVSSVITNPTKTIFDEKTLKDKIVEDTAYLIRSERIQKHSTAFAALHELWHQLLIKTSHYLARSNKVIHNPFGVKITDIAERERYLKNILYDDIEGLHYDETTPNLSMSKGKLETYGGIPHFRFLYRGDINFPNQNKCFQILPTQYELYYEFMSRAYGRR